MDYTDESRLIGIHSFNHLIQSLDFTESRPGGRSYRWESGIGIPSYREISIAVAVRSLDFVRMAVGGRLIAPTNGIKWVAAYGVCLLL